MASIRIMETSPVETSMATLGQTLEIFIEGKEPIHRMGILLYL